MTPEREATIRHAWGAICDDADFSKGEPVTMQLPRAESDFGDTVNTATLVYSEFGSHHGMQWVIMCEGLTLETGSVPRQWGAGS